MPLNSINGKASCGFRKYVWHKSLWLYADHKTSCPLMLAMTACLTSGGGAIPGVRAAHSPCTYWPARFRDEIKRTIREDACSFTKTNSPLTLRILSPNMVIVNYFAANGANAFRDRGWMGRLRGWRRLVLHVRSLRDFASTSAR